MIKPRPASMQVGAFFLKTNSIPYELWVFVRTQINAIHSIASRNSALIRYTTLANIAIKISLIFSIALKILWTT